MPFARNLRQPAAERRQRLVVADDGQTEFTLEVAPRADSSGDWMLHVVFNSVPQHYGTDFTVDGTTLTWESAVPLEEGEVLDVTIWPA